MNTLFAKQNFFGGPQSGVTLIMAVLTLSVLLSISIGVSVILLGQFVVQKQSAYSFQAMYAADTGMEKTFYLDRMLNACGTGTCSTGVFFPATLSGTSCYRVTVITTPGCGGPGSTRCITSLGQYRCGVNVRFVQRSFLATY